jgi:hypothetical protein
MQPTVVVINSIEELGDDPLDDDCVIFPTLAAAGLRIWNARQVRQETGYN